MMAKITVLFFDFTKTEHGHYCFAVASERLIARVRLAACSVMLRQDIGWFDMPENASGVFLARLSSDSTTLLALTSETLNRLMVTVSTLVIVFAVCFYFSWVLTLILLAVASLGMEQELSSKYKELLEVSKRTDTRGGLVSGAALGFSLGMVLLIAALLFYVSSRWISHGTITFEDMFVMLMVLSLSSFSIGSAAQGATDPKRAQQAAENIFEIIDRVPVIDALSTDGKTFSSVKESLEFRDVQFAYPLPWLRDRISLVGQEPVLFAMTTAENVALGKLDATREERSFKLFKTPEHWTLFATYRRFETNRIALARAIVRDPDILLLDEATSALDNEIERIVQYSLNRLLKLKQRTTLIISTHDEMVQNTEGRYRQLQTN
ncbi:ATP-binding Cassette (ABC) Superfamily [Phytophthora infestans T30-4]|uniref:ATP-binding Cassette (ABC) Superfamily n=1 Tax=Phytophthora infestans (strain T30-4) TaxID=403677 RepID=D0N4X4_PHYIT|nr:ATP-binding Cassette (ABC) Superfamily [Phytophthora infestans T30-4]EEY69932.1 ATP-binding Cassette (ABC) Superfamily [Phytophthora infestans T30-4]|eukprot:XP_002998579.1 ATP-binding Cassette (ABC) Superfamily [Phytophthora infestans T30-4]